MRVLITGGGTGGHVYPGLAVAESLRNGSYRQSPADAHEPIELLWVGSVGGMEGELVERAGIALAVVHGGGLHGVAVQNMILNGARLVQGFFEAQALIKRWRPQAFLATGGYASVAVALACRMAGVPGLVYLPDIEPGQAIEFLARVTTRVAVTAEVSRQYFPGRTVSVTGYPVRPEFRGLTRTAARATLGLSDSEPVLLVFGGSRGARSLNEAVGAHLRELLAVCQIVHVSGTLDWPNVEAARAALDAAQQARYHAYPYLHEEMGPALAAADLVISRAGASCLGEFPLFGLPAVLVPYPYAWRYQRVNADYLAERGAGVRVDDAALAGQIVALVQGLLGDAARLAQMRVSAQALAVPDAAERLARAVVALVRPAPTVVAG